MNEAPAPEPSTVLLFVYGSLKSGYENAHLLAGATLLGPARTAPGYRLIRYCDGYPGLVPALHSESSVKGELYAVDAARLGELDAFEECPALYRRASIELDDQQIVQAYVVAEENGGAWPGLERY
jgi:gamma-glutamylaminecyclotransferase